MVKAAGTRCEEPIAGKSDYGMSEKVQTGGIRRVRRWIQRPNGKCVDLLLLMRKLKPLSVVRRHQLYAH